MRPKLLDLFCCSGGAGEGYARAGFDVTGVDIVGRPNYPHRFSKDDALKVLHRLVDLARANYVLPYDAVHASPPVPVAMRHDQGNERTPR